MVSSPRISKARQAAASTGTRTWTSRDEAGLPDAAAGPIENPGLETTPNLGVLRLSLSSTVCVVCWVFTCSVKRSASATGPSPCDSARLRTQDLEPPDLDRPGRHWQPHQQGLCDASVPGPPTGVTRLVCEVRLGLRVVSSPEISIGLAGCRINRGKDYAR